MASAVVSLPGIVAPTLELTEKVGEIHPGVYFSTKDAVGGRAFLQGTIEIVTIRGNVPLGAIVWFIVTPKILLGTARHPRGAEELA